MRAAATCVALAALLLPPTARAAPAPPASAPASQPAKAPAKATAKASAKGKTAKPKGDSEASDPRWCRACHTQRRFSKKRWARGAHAEQTCRDCHSAHAFNPHEKPKASEDDAVKAIKKAKLFTRDPVAAASCGNCHDDVGVGELVHGRGRTKRKADKQGAGTGSGSGTVAGTGTGTGAGTGSGTGAGTGSGAGKADKKKADKHKRLTPWCSDCHGDAHSVRLAKSMKPRARRLMMNERCLACHADKKRMSRAGIKSPVAHSYHDSMHARLLALGSSRAPGCIDCHGSHKLVSRDPASMAKRCAKCHKGATKKFATLVSHKPISSRPASYYTQKFFAWLTFLTILFLALHVLIDLSHALRHTKRQG